MALQGNRALNYSGANWFQEKLTCSRDQIRFWKIKKFSRVKICNKNDYAIIKAW